MAKNIVVCCDGTGNQIERNLSNVLKLFRITSKNELQHVYYNAGIGTIGSSDAWSRWRQNVKSIFELATGYGLDADILGVYIFICRHLKKTTRFFFLGSAWCLHGKGRRRHDTYGWLAAHRPT